MATMLLSPIGILVQQLANSGQPLSGGLVNTYVAGTTTPVVTYTDSTGTVQNSNPIVLNSAGRLTTSVWVPSNTPHKMILTDSSAVTLSTIDQLYGINDPFLINQISSSLPTGGGTANAQTIANTTAITTQGNGTEQWYTPGVANTGPTNINVDSLGNMAARYLTKALVGGELQPGVPVILKSDSTFWNLAWSAKGPEADYYVDTGSVNALAVTINMAQAAQGSALGTKIRVKAAFTTTAASPTITVNGQVFNIVSTDGANSPAVGSIIAGLIYEFIAFGVTVAYALQNPSRVTGSFTATLATGLTTTPTGTLNYAILPTGKDWSCWATAAFSGTSNASGMTITGIPAALTNTTDKEVYAIMTNGGGTAQGGIRTGTSTTWTALLNSAGAIGPTNFATSGTKGIPQRFYFTSSTD